jgi:hypothetical protein
LPAIGRDDAADLVVTATIDHKITMKEGSNTNPFADIREALRRAKPTPRSAGLSKRWEPTKNELSDHLVFERVSQKLSVSCDVKRLHHSILVKGDRAWSHVDHTCNLLHRQALREQL